MTLWQRVAARMASLLAESRKLETLTVTTVTRNLTEEDHKNLDAAFAKFDEGFAELGKLFDTTKQK